MKADTYTVAEVAKKLRVSEYTIRREIAEDRMPTVPFAGRVVRVPARFVDELIR